MIQIILEVTYYRIQVSLSLFVLASENQVDMPFYIPSSSVISPHAHQHLGAIDLLDLSHYWVLSYLTVALICMSFLSMTKHLFSDHSPFLHLSKYLIFSFLSVFYFLSCKSSFYILVQVFCLTIMLQILISNLLVIFLILFTTSSKSKI